MTLCHGPGCTREARTEFWCSEACQARWHGQFDDPSPQPWLPPEAWRLAAAALPGLQDAFARQVEAERLALEVRAMCPPDYLETAMAAVDERSTSVGYEAALRSVGDDLKWGRLPASTGAAYQQVASENQQVECGQPGWLSRAFGRLFGKGAA